MKEKFPYLLFVKNEVKKRSAAARLEIYCKIYFCHHLRSLVSGPNQPAAPDSMLLQIGGLQNLADKGDVPSAGGDSHRTVPQVNNPSEPNAPFKHTASNSAPEQYERVLYITGMTCHSCVMAIESKVSSLLGVTRIKVDLVAEKAEVIYNSDIVKLNEIANCIRELSFDVSQQPPADRAEGSESTGSVFGRNDNKNF